MAGNVTIREIQPEDHSIWLEMRELLWPDFSLETLKSEQLEILTDGNRNGVLVAAAGEEVIGFAEVSLRQWAEGCTTHPVGYIEAWYVAPGRRRSGVGRMLIEAAEKWARQRGCTEMGSDADLDNRISHQAHRALGFTEIGSAVLFAKKLSS